LTRSVAIFQAFVGHAREQQLPDRKGVEALVADDADVELAALDVAARRSRRRRCCSCMNCDPLDQLRRRSSTTDAWEIPADDS
jgi:hypothetical protein